MSGGSEFVVVETIVDGEALVGEIPDGAIIPNDVLPDQLPLTVEQAEQVVENLNNPE